MKELPTDGRSGLAWRGLPDDKPMGFSGTQVIALEKKGSQNLVWQNLAQRWSFSQKKSTRCNLWSHWLSWYSFLSSSFSFPRVWGACMFFIFLIIIILSLQIFVSGYSLVHGSPRSKSIRSHSSRRTELGKLISFVLYKKVRMKVVVFLYEQPPALGFDIKTIIYSWGNELIPGSGTTKQGQSTRLSWRGLCLVPNTFWISEIVYSIYNFPASKNNSPVCNVSSQKWVKQTWEIREITIFCF